MKVAAPPVSLICLGLALVLPCQVLAQESGAPVKKNRDVFVSKGKDSKEGSFKSTVTVQALGAGKFLVTRTVTYRDGSGETLSGPARRANDGSLRAKLCRAKTGAIPSLKRVDLLKPTRRLKISIDDESGFCVVLSWTRTASSRAQGKRAAGIRLEPAPEPKRRPQAVEKPGKGLQ